MNQVIEMRRSIDRQENSTREQINFAKKWASRRFIAIIELLEMAGLKISDIKDQISEKFIFIKVVINDRSVIMYTFVIHLMRKRNKSIKRVSKYLEHALPKTAMVMYKYQEPEA